MSDREARRRAVREARVRRKLKEKQGLLTLLRKKITQNSSGGAASVEHNVCGWVDGSSGQLSQFTPSQARTARARQQCRAPHPLLLPVFSSGAAGLLHAFEHFKKSSGASGEGKITLANFRVALRNSGVVLADPVTAQLFNQLDTDGSGHIDYEEFVKGVFGVEAVASLPSADEWVREQERSRARNRQRREERKQALQEDPLVLAREKIAAYATGRNPTVQVQKVFKKFAGDDEEARTSPHPRPPGRAHQLPNLRGHAKPPWAHPPCNGHPPHACSDTTARRTAGRQIGLEGFRVALRKMGIFNDVNSMKIFRQIDTNGNGYIDFVEFSNAIFGSEHARV